MHEITYKSTLKNDKIDKNLHFHCRDIPKFRRIKKSIILRLEEAPLLLPFGKEPSKIHPTERIEDKNIHNYTKLLLKIGELEEKKNNKIGEGVEKCVAEADLCPLRLG